MITLEMIRMITKLHLYDHHCSFIIAYGEEFCLVSMSRNLFSLEINCRFLLKKVFFWFRCDDHNYSSSKYDSVLEPEDVVEISADGSLQPFCDEGVGEETDESVTNNDSDSPLYNSVVDSSGSHYCGQSETNEFKKYALA